MRWTTMLAMVCVCGALGATGCSTMQKVEKEAGGLKGAEDDSILVAAKLELSKNAKTKGHNFEVAVKAGVVTLTGAGPADAKAEAAKVVMAAGAVKVENKIVVK